MLQDHPCLSIAIALTLVLPGIQTSHAQASLFGTTWTTHSPSPTARMGAAGFAYEGKLYACGGLGNDLRSIRSCEVFDPATNSWSSLAPIPRGVSHAGVQIVDGTAWLVGGFEADEPGPVVDIVQIYEFASDTWRSGPPLVEPRAAGTLALLGRKLHYVGGLLPDRQTDVSEHLVLDVDHPEDGWSPLAPLPARRNQLSSAVLGGKLYVFGGKRGHDRTRVFSRFVHVYDYSTDSWLRLSDLPESRSHGEASTFVHNGRIIIAGGLGPGPASEASSDQILAYDPAADAWSDIGRLPERMHGFVGGVLGQRFVVAHGSVGNTEDVRSATYSIGLNPEQIDPLGFWPFVRDVHLTRGSSLRLDALLWTEYGRANFTVDETALPAWVTLTSEPSGVAVPEGTRISARADATNLSVGTHRGTITATAPGYPPAKLDILLTVTPTSTNAFVEEDGLVVAGTENFHLKQAGLSHDWAITAIYQSSGASVVASPDEGALWDTDFHLKGPELGYRILFSTPGTYYVWIRGWGPNGKADSWHVGMDGVPVATADRMVLTKRRSWPPLWLWSNTTMDGPRATLDVTSPGERIVNIWMREDGTHLDRLLLTTDPDYVPDAEGPAESRSIRSSAIETGTVDGPDAGLPSAVILHSNYPNPFNTSTLIRFSVPKADHVRLAIYDLLGRQTALLIDEWVGAGGHEVRFEGSDLPSGMYLFELRTGGSILVRPMLLVR